MKKMIISVIKVISFSISGFVIYLYGYLYVKQENLIFYNRYIQKKSSSMLNYKNTIELFFTTKDGNRLNGVLLENDKNFPTAIYFGGNGEDATNFIEIAKEIKGYNFLIFNYRGYGLSEGNPSKDLILSDSTQIYDRYLNKNSAVIGRSLGSSVATYLSSQKEIKKLLLITPFDSIKSIANDMFKIPVSIILKHNFDTVEYIKNNKTSTFMLTASKDKTIPKKYSDNLKKEIKNLKLDREVDGNHNYISDKDMLKFLNDSLF